MSALTILSDWKKNVFKPLYWLEGEEEFYIDEVMEYAEKKILSAADAEFNLSIFYGKDANWADVIKCLQALPNVCRAPGSSFERSPADEGY